MLYALSHLAFLHAFVALRTTRADAPRPFQLPGGTGAAIAIALAPCAICVAAIGENLRAPRRALAFGVTLAVGLLVQLGSQARAARTLAAAACEWLRGRDGDTPRRRDYNSLP